MVPLKKEILALAASLETWRFLFENWNYEDEFISLQLPRSEEDVVSNLDLLRADKMEKEFKDEVSVNFAVSDVLLTLGRLQECCYAMQEQWPYRKGWCDELLKNTLLDNVLPACVFKRFARDYELDSSIVLARLEFIAEHVENSDLELPIETRLSLVWEYREALMRCKVLEQNRDCTQFSKKIQKRIKERFDPMIDSLSSDDQFIWHLKQYLLNAYLPPWFFYKPGPQSIYQPIYDKTQRENDLLLQNLEKLSDFLKRRYVNKRLPSDLPVILERISRSISDMDYHEYVKKAISGGGQWGENSAVGSMGPVNIIPEATKTPQAKNKFNKMPVIINRLQSELTIAFIIGRDDRRKTSFKNALKNLRDHLVTFDDETAVVVISDIWDMKLMRDNLLKFGVYKNQPQKFIFLLAHGRSLTPIDINS